MSELDNLKQVCCCCDRLEDVEEAIHNAKKGRFGNYEFTDPVINNELRSYPSVQQNLVPEPTLPVSVPVSASISAIEKILSKPNIISRSEQLVLPSFTDSGELRSNGTKASLFEEEEEVGVVPPPPPPPPPPVLLVQYTPNYSPGGVSGADCVNYQTSVVNGLSMRHDPDGIGWISPASWVDAQWDGVTTWNPNVLTAGQLSAGIFPNVNTMRGLRELFYAKAPFADNQNPTVAEIDNWNIEVLKHFRRLLGRFDSDPINNDAKLYYQAHWATERYKSTVWDSRYPYDAGKPGTWGPCVKPGPGDNVHCGASFVPDCADQIPYYLDPAQTCVGDTSFAEGIFSVNTNLPWAIKFARTIGITLLTDGKGGHTAPFLGTRSKVGLSWACGPTTSSLRVKWG